MCVLCLGREQRAQKDAEGTEERQGGRREGRCVNYPAHSKCSICVHSLPREGGREGAEGQKGEREERNQGRRKV